MEDLTMSMKVHSFRSKLTVDVKLIWVRANEMDLFVSFSYTFTIIFIKED